MSVEWPMFILQSMVLIGLSGVFFIRGEGDQ